MEVNLKEVTQRLTWPLFQIEWHRLMEDPFVTVEQVVNALYLAGEVPFTPAFLDGGPDHPPIDQTAALDHDVLSRGEFFLQVRAGMPANLEIQIAAARRFVAKVLAQAKIPQISATTHSIFLEFLARPESHLGLVTPPYPRFIQEYLELVNRWLASRCQSFHNSEELNSRLQALHTSLQAYRAMLIRSMCNWGLAHELLSSTRHMEDVQLMVEELRQFVGGRAAGTMELILRHCQTLPPIHDFACTSTGRGGVEECRIRAVLVLAARGDKVVFF